MQISNGAIVAGTGCDPFVAIEWQEALQAACDKYQINTPNRVAAFLSNVGVETGGLTAFVENLDYSAASMARVWKTRYAIDPTQPPPRTPNALALRLQHNPEALANNVYANRLGNGNEASGDGWKFRGQGPIQLTGRENITNCGKAIGLDLASDPSQLQHPVAGALSAAWFFFKNGCNELADAGNIDGVITKINGTAPCDANHGPLRKSRYDACLKQIQAE